MWPFVAPSTTWALKSSDTKKRPLWIKRLCQTMDVLMMMPSVLIERYVCIYLSIISSNMCFDLLATHIVGRVSLKVVLLNRQ